MDTQPFVNPVRAGWWAVTAFALFALLLTALGFGIGYGVAVSVRPAALTPATRTQQPSTLSTITPGSPSLPPELELRYQLLRSQLDDAAENSRRIDRMITLLLTLTSLYALALGLNSYFGLRQILESGKDDLAKLREFLTQARGDVREGLQRADTEVRRTLDSATSEFDNFKRKLEEKYPELANLHDNLRDLLGGIQLMFPRGRDWTLQYKLLSPEQREKIELAEMRMAGLEVFRLGYMDPFRPRVLEVYWGLARFYSSKYNGEGEVGRSSWERASLYFDISVQLDPLRPSAELMKDLGVHLTLVEQKLEMRKAGITLPSEIREIEALRTRAGNAFKESVGADPDEPGALFGLAWLLYKKRDYSDAIRHLAVIAGISQWEDGDREKYLEDAHLNQACCYSLLGDEDSSENDYTAALVQLQNSREVAVEYERLSQWKTKVKAEAGLGDQTSLEDPKVPKVLRSDLMGLQAARPDELNRLLV